MPTSIVMTVTIVAMILTQRRLNCKSGENLAKLDFEFKVYCCLSVLIEAILFLKDVIK